MFHRGQPQPDFQRPTLDLTRRIGAFLHCHFLENLYIGNVNETQASTRHQLSPGFVDGVDSESTLGDPFDFG